LDRIVQIKEGGNPVSVPRKELPAMINPMRFVVFLLLLPVHSGSAAEDTNGVNAAPLYWPVFSNVTAWATAHPGYGRLPATNVSSPEAAAAYDDLQPHLAGLQAAGEQATYCDWGTRYEDGIAALLPHVNPAGQSMKAALWAAHYAASNNLPTFAGHALEAMRIGRDVGEDRLILDLLVQIAGEKPAAELLLQNIDRLDEKQLAGLDAKLHALPPGATLIDAMQMEKAMFVDNLIRQFLDAMRHADTNLFEVSYGESGAVSDEMRGTKAMAGSDASTNRSWLTENLRMSAMVELSSGSRIGFETLNGDSFFISLGRPQRGIELLSMDYDREEAVIALQGATTQGWTPPCGRYGADAAWNDQGGVASRR
jgi:hypothetical protein